MQCNAWSAAISRLHATLCELTQKAKRSEAREINESAPDVDSLPRPTVLVGMAAWLQRDATRI
jgi:hypothetical protein